jgi:hypothetical protein
MEPRIASSVLAGALIRKAEGQGGFGAVLAKGDPSAGSILVILLERGANPRLYERLLQADGRYAWLESGSQRIENPSEVPGFIARLRRFDPDSWLIELDIPSAERFAAEMNDFD